MAEKRKKERKRMSNRSRSIREKVKRKVMSGRQASAKNRMQEGCKQVMGAAELGEPGSSLNWPMNQPRLLLCRRNEAANNEVQGHKNNFIAMHVVGTWVEKFKLSTLTHGKLMCLPLKNCKGASYKG